jgi:glyoxylase-like metal-dependent hydrolase (beta-lactamase superfamily II)
MPFLVLLLAAVSAAQPLPPGYVDPAPVLDAARKAIGADALRCVTIEGTAYTGAVGQQRESGWNVDWPKGAPLTNYRREMNWDAGTMIEQFDREAGRNPASWKWGLGWLGGTPIQKHSRQTFAVNGGRAWHIDGAQGTPLAASPEDAGRWQLDLWLNPHGFLKAARHPGANPRAVWRWELGEMGRDGNTTIPDKVTVVSITMFGKYRVDATINKEHLLQRIHTWVPDPVLGDFNYEHEFANDTYVDLGAGIRFPTVWHHHEGWDDNFGALNVSAGHNAFGGTIAGIKANACADPPAVPASLTRTEAPPRAETTKLADGVYLLGGATHNSVGVEFKDFIAVVEAPLNEERSLAVIEEVTRLIPSKPIRFLVSTHQHFDHIGGIRTYMHIGATIVTQTKNYEFLKRDVLNYAPRTVAPDMVSLWPPTELTEGYQYEVVNENYVISDGVRNMHITYVQPLEHAEGMLMAYLPAGKIAIEADLYDTHESAPKPSPANLALLRQVRRLRLDVETIVPIHGKPARWADFVRFAVQ